MSEDQRTAHHSSFITHHRRLWTPLFALACLSNFTTWVAGYMLLGTLTLNAVALGAPEGQVGLYPACSSIFALIMQLVGGRLLVRAPRTLLMRLGPLLMIAATLLALAALSAPVLFAVVILFASGYSIAQSAAMVLVTETAPPARRGQAVGLYGTFTTLGVLIGPASGVALLQQLGGRSVFAVMLLMAVAALVSALLIREPPRRQTRAGEGSLRLHPRAYAAAGAMFGMTATWGTVLAFLPLYALGLGLGNPGLYFTVQALGVLSLRMVAGSLSDRFGRVQVLVPAMTLVALGVAGLALHPSLPLLMLLALLYGVGYSAIHPTTIAVADDVSTNATRGMALGLVGGMFSIGVGTGAATMGYVLQRTSYETMFLVASSIPVVATVLFVWSWRTFPKPSALSHQLAARPFR
ncbi:MAG TPA: MFS transporter [Chloroflexota bacterium]|nr:MFS transporter [Chloroflexota bacterium]